MTVLNVDNEVRSGIALQIQQCCEIALVDARRVTVRWVRGHAGDTHNERVDGLANRALREAREGGLPKPLGTRLV